MPPSTVTLICGILYNIIPKIHLVNTLSHAGACDILPWFGYWVCCMPPAIMMGGTCTEGGGVFLFGGCPSVTGCVKFVYYTAYLTYHPTSSLIHIWSNNHQMSRRILCGIHVHSIIPLNVLRQLCAIFRTWFTMSS